jgi:hypothetical protein
MGAVAMAVSLLVAGCSPAGGRAETIAEGTIYYVEFTKAGGGAEGFTRVNSSTAVPGRNGSWNMDAYGRLTRDFLTITRPRQKDLGPLVIPVHRLVSIQFGDGGIKTVSENHPAAPQ